MASEKTTGTEFMWLLEFNRQEGQVGGPNYVGRDGFVTDDPHKAMRFETKEAAESHLNQVRVLRNVRPVEHGFWQEVA